MGSTAAMGSNLFVSTTTCCAGPLPGLIGLELRGVPTSLMSFTLVVARDLGIPT
jgi:hypothetical protein